MTTLKIIALTSLGSWTCAATKKWRSYRTKKSETQGKIKKKKRKEKTSSLPFRSLTDRFGPTAYAGLLKYEEKRTPWLNIIALTTLSHEHARQRKSEEEEKEWDARRSFKAGKENTENILQFISLIDVRPTAYAGLLKYVYRWPSPFWEATASRKTDPPPPPKHEQLCDFTESLIS